MTILPAIHSLQKTESKGAEPVQALHFLAGVPRPVEDHLVQEGPLQISVNGAPYSVTMRTPGDDTALALGLLFTEGLLTSLQDAESHAEIPASASASTSAFTPISTSASETNKTDTVNVTLPKASHLGRALSNRRLASTASCGVCGKISGDDLEGPAAAGPTRRGFDLSLIPALEGRMRNAQALFAQTGGSHAAAVFDLQGRLLVLKEDVGRHNAVDKAVGQLLIDNLLDRAAILFISGRVSYEIVTKASRAGISYLLAVSAPSTLAVSMCREAGITLLAFCRGGKATVYSHPETLMGHPETVTAYPQTPVRAAEA